ncbi:MAG: hypothetical protein JKY65_29820 [Planctomycetes bacterium]|nr:hypothetical protein [Planctomycetota bacterium]
MDTDVVQAELTRWIVSLMPCVFARWLANTDGRLPVTVFDGEDREDDLELVSLFLDQTEDDTHVFVFPWVRTSSDLRSLFEDFRADPRWFWSEVVGAPVAPGLTALSLLWETNEGYLSQAMGLAPLLSMPCDGPVTEWCMIDGARSSTWCGIQAASAGQGRVGKLSGRGAWPGSVTTTVMTAISDHDQDGGHDHSDRGRSGPSGAVAAGGEPSTGSALGRRGRG